MGGNIPTTYVVAYKKEHNDDTTNVPQIYKEDPQLGGWVRTQLNALLTRRER